MSISRQSQLYPPLTCASLLPDTLNTPASQTLPARSFFVIPMQELPNMSSHAAFSLPTSPASDYPASPVPRQTTQPSVLDQELCFLVPRHVISFAELSLRMAAHSVFLCTTWHPLIITDGSLTPCQFCPTYRRLLTGVLASLVC